jgi:hypothetical protein
MWMKEEIEVYNEAIEHRISQLENIKGALHGARYGESCLLCQRYQNEDDTTYNKCRDCPAQKIHGIAEGKYSESVLCHEYVIRMGDIISEITKIVKWLRLFLED